MGFPGMLILLGIIAFCDYETIQSISYFLFWAYIILIVLYICVKVNE